jgi:trans-aconitate methyltransferase
MLARAQAKVNGAGLHNVDFVEADMQTLPGARRFEVVTCAFGIFFVEDMDAQLGRLVRSASAGGRVAITTFARNYMEPMRTLVIKRAQRHGVEPPPQAWLRLADPDGCHRFFTDAGLADVTVATADVGYALTSADEWWEIVWNAGLRRQVSRIPEAERATFKAEHLAEVEALRTPVGIPMSIPVLYTSGRTGAC